MTVHKWQQCPASTAVAHHQQLNGTPLWQSQCHKLLAVSTTTTGMHMQEFPAGKKGVFFEHSCKQKTFLREFPAPAKSGRNMNSCEIPAFSRNCRNLCRNCRKQEIPTPALTKQEQEQEQENEAKGGPRETSYPNGQEGGPIVSLRSCQ